MTQDRLWAPWRSEYVAGRSGREETPPPAPTSWPQGADQKCFLCRGAAQYADVVAADRALLVLRRTDQCLTMLNRYPYSHGHLLVAPLRHVADFGGLSRDEHLACMEDLARVMCSMGQVIRAQGFNIGLNVGKVAGAGVPGHLHWHLVPRWECDNNFMPMLAETRVIPQSLEALWEILADSADGAGA